MANSLAPGINHGIGSAAAVGNSLKRSIDSVMDSDDDSVAIGTLKRLKQARLTYAEVHAQFFEGAPLHDGHPDMTALLYQQTEHANLFRYALGRAKGGNPCEAFGPNFSLDADLIITGLLAAIHYNFDGTETVFALCAQNPSLFLKKHVSITPEVQKEENAFLATFDFGKEDSKKWLVVLLDLLRESISGYKLVGRSGKSVHKCMMIASAWANSVKDSDLSAGGVAIWLAFSASDWSTEDKRLTFVELFGTDWASAMAILKLHHSLSLSPGLAARPNALKYADFTEAIAFEEAAAIDDGEVCLYLLEWMTVCVPD
jgi:hypothetical protein